MKRLTKSDWIAISGFFLVITFLSLWAIDISVSALIHDGYLTNGFFISNPTMIYHFGLYFISIACFSNFLIMIHLLFKMSAKEETKQIKTYPEAVDAE